MASGSYIKKFKHNSQENSPEDISRVRVIKPKLTRTNMLIFSDKTIKHAKSRRNDIFFYIFLLGISSVLMIYLTLFIAATTPSTTDFYTGGTTYSISVASPVNVNKVIRSSSVNKSNETQSQQGFYTMPYNIYKYFLEYIHNPSNIGLMLDISGILQGIAVLAGFFNFLHKKFAKKAV